MKPVDRLLDLGFRFACWLAEWTLFQAKVRYGVTYKNRLAFAPVVAGTVMKILGKGEIVDQLIIDARRSPTGVELGMSLSVGVPKERAKLWLTAILEGMDDPENKHPEWVENREAKS